MLGLFFCFILFFDIQVMYAESQSEEKKHLQNHRSICLLIMIVAIDVNSTLT